MANVFNNGTAGIAVNPIVVDTAWTTGTIPAALVAIAANGLQWFRRIVWQGGTAADVATITDVNSNLLMTATCPVTGQEVVLWQNDTDPYKMPRNGQWVVSAIPHGKIVFTK